MVVLCCSSTWALDRHQASTRRGLMRNSNCERTRFALFALICLLGCRSNMLSLPPDPPNYRGQAAGRDLRSGTGSLGELSMLRLVPGSGTSKTPTGFVRIDSATRFIFNKRAGIDSTELALPGLQWAQARVWFNVGPTSKTAEEIWGNARLVVVDSAGVRPTTTSPVRISADSL